MTQNADGNIQSIEVKDQFGSKFQKYFKTMHIDEEVKEGGVLHTKLAQRQRDKHDGQEHMPIDFNASIVDYIELRIKQRSRWMTLRRSKQRI